MKRRLLVGSPTFEVGDDDFAVDSVAVLLDRVRDHGVSDGVEVLSVDGLAAAGACLFVRHVLQLTPTVIFMPLA